MPEWQTPMEKVEVGKGRIIKEGEDLAILTIGHIGNYAVEVTDKLTKEGIDVGHFDMRFVKPLDEEMLHHIFSRYSRVVTVEDGCLMGGFGSAILEFMADNQYSAQVIRLGIPDKIVEHGEQRQLHDECNFGPEGIYAAAKKLLEPVASPL